MTDQKIAEAARRCARVTPYPLDEWELAAEAWWAGGHDLDRLVDWVEGESAVTPYLVVNAVEVMYHTDAPTVPAYQPPPGRPDRFTVWTQNAVVVVVAVALVAIVVTVTWRLVDWIAP